MTNIANWPEEALKAAFDQLKLKEGEAPRIIDVGAHKGETFLSIYKHFQDNFSYWGFEPNGPTYQELIKNVGSFVKEGQIDFFEKAVGPENGIVKFLKTQDSAVAGMLPAVEGLNERVPAGDHKIEEELEVEMISIDQFFGKHSADQSYHILKVDTEGFDLDVLKGSSTLLDKGAFQVVLTEAFFVPYRQKQAYFWDIATYMEKKGYQFLNLFDMRNTGQGRLYTCNAVWVSPNLAAQNNFL